MKNYYETLKETEATIAGKKLMIAKGVELTRVLNAGDCSGYAVKSRKHLASLGVGAHDATHYYAYVPLDSVFIAEHVRAPLKAKSDDWQETANKWLIKINGQEFDYYTGSEIEKAPDYDCVMHSLAMDSDALEQEFEDWAQALDYDTDSRKAYAIWEACCDNTRKLIKAGIDINAERERLQDY